MPGDVDLDPASADVVIIGGGVVGTSAAFHLAEAGAGVVLLERDQLGSGSTSKAAGGVRTQFSDPLNIEIAQRSLAAFKDFDRRPGWEIDLHEVGYLFLLSASRTWTRSPRASRSRTSSASRPGFSPRRGARAEPAARGRRRARRQLLARGRPRDAGGRRAGLRLRRPRARRPPADEPRGRAHRTRDGRIAAVHAGATTVRTDTVICAAGAWSRRCGELAGVELPVTPLRRQVLFTEPMDGLPARLPLTIDFSTTFYFHREGPGLLFGMSDPTEVPGFDIETTDDWIPALLEIAERRAPRVADGRHPRRLGGPVRHEPGPQRDHRRGHRRVALPLRHRLLRPRVPAGPGDRRAAARPRPRAAHLRRHRAAQRRALRPAPTCAPSATSCDADSARAPPVERRRGRRRPARRHPRGRLKPGERLKEIPLAEQLGISRGPIRDALRLLERDGLIDVIPNRGAVVPEVHALDVLEVYALRASLGSLALHKLMLENALPVTALERALRPLRGAVERGRAARPPTPTSATSPRSSPAPACRASPASSSG